MKNAARRNLAALSLAGALALTQLPASYGTQEGAPASPVSASQPAASGDFRVVEASMSWGVKESFRRYLKMPLAKGGWSVSDGLTETNGIFNWTQGTGALSRTDHTGTVSLPGTVRFTGHEGKLDLVFTNLRIRFDGGTKGTLLLDARSKNMQGENITLTNAEFATLDLSGVRPSRVGNRTAVTVTNAPVTLTAEGQKAFADFYKAGQALDPLSFSIPLEAMAGRFSDVPADHPFHKEVLWLAEKGITTGWADGTFRPAEDVQRAAMAAFFYRLAGKPAFVVPEVPTFRDVPVSHPFYKEIEWMAASKITTGWEVAGGREFRPAESVQRAPMAAFMYRFAGSPAFVAGGSSFVDVDASHPFAREIAWLASVGVSKGWADGSFRPSDHVQRAPMAAFMYRFDAGVKRK